MSDGIELDRSPSGKIRVNAISLANLIALLGLIWIAFQSWNTMTVEVAKMTVRVDAFSSEFTRMAAQSSRRDAEMSEVKATLSQMTTRLTVLETTINRALPAKPLANP